MKKKYYIIWEEYSEWNQFEGEWNVSYNSYPTLKKARIAYESLIKNNNVKNVSKILKEL